MIKFYASSKKEYIPEIELCCSRPLTVCLLSFVHKQQLKQLLC